MKYAVMFTRGEWEDAAPDAERQQRYAEIGEWWRRLIGRGKMVEGYQLAPPYTATTIVFSGGNAQIEDGPHTQGREMLSGYCILELADLDEAIAIVRSFPSMDSNAEIRPVVERQRPR